MQKGEKAVKGCSLSATPLEREQYPLSAAEREQILEQCDTTQKVYSPHHTFMEIFAEQVQRNPRNLAVVSGQRKLTYLELDAQTNQFARTLRIKGAGPEEVIAIVVDNSLDMLMGVLAVLKAGAAYLVVDMNNPATRIKFMLKDSRAKYLITRSNFLAQLNLEEFTGEVFCLDDRGLYHENTTPLKCVNLPEDLAYVVYTPGAQGIANGVIIEHRALNNLIAWYVQSFELTALSRYGKYALLSCDVSTWEMFPCLAVGGTLHLVDGPLRGVNWPGPLLDRIHFAVRRLNEYFEAHGITHTFLPLGVAESFMAQKSSTLQYLLVDSDCQPVESDKSSLAGEAVFDHPQYQVVRIYELPEALICASHRVGRVKANPGEGHLNWSSADFNGTLIGQPVDKVRIFIVDEAGNLQPAGVPGEICIAGDSLALGYLNRLELTGYRFVFNQFDGRGRMFKTGEIGKWLPDGNIVYLGRQDRQVKIFGYRVEPGEVESYLWRHPEINSVSVTTQTNAGGVRYLVAHYSASREIFSAELRAYLEKRLPEYMIPAQLVQVSSGSV